MPRYAPNKMPVAVKRRYFELIRTGLVGRRRPLRKSGVSLSCGSLWFIDAGRVSFVETPISPRYLSQDDRIEIADGLRPGRAGQADRGADRQVLPNRLPRDWLGTGRSTDATSPGSRTTRPICGDGGPSAPVRCRCRAARGRGRQARQALVPGADQPLAAATLTPRRRDWQVCTETIYEAVYRGLIVPVDRQNLRTGRTYRRRRGRGRTRDGALKQSTAMKSIHHRPAASRHGGKPAIGRVI